MSSAESDISGNPRLVGLVSLPAKLPEKGHLASEVPAKRSSGPLFPIDEQKNPVATRAAAG